MIPQNDLITTIGKTTGYYRPRCFGIRQADRLMHVYLIGQTGTGKTTFLHQLMRQDRAAGMGFCFLDPHGDLAEAMAAEAPGLYWNPADPACTLGYNPLSYVTPEFRPLLASGLIETLKKQYASQNDRDVLDAIIGNFGTIICFRLGANDGPLFAKHLDTPGVESRDLINLPNYHMFVRLMVDGQQTRAFSAKTLP